MYQTVASTNTVRGPRTKNRQRMRSQVPLLIFWSKAAKALSTTPSKGVAFAGLLAWIFCSAIGAAFADEPLRLADCRLESALAGGSAAARCGRYRVRETRDDPHDGVGKELQLHVAVIPALRLKPAADPLFILSGGPGQAASDFYLSVAPAFTRIRRDRDLVLIDQRGTGRSNRLECDLPDDSGFIAFDSQKLQAAVRQCLAALPGDPRYYTTSIAVRDLDEVRAALGYRTLNLYGISYGTRVAQHYMRRYPQRVRSAILDGVVPAEVALGPDIPIEAQRAIDVTLQRCARDAACAQEFPDISAQFTALQAKLRKEPEKLSIQHPLTGALTDTTLDAARLGVAVRLLSYADETVSTLPLLIHEAQSLRDLQSVAAQYLRVESNLQELIAEGRHFAVVCSEDAPRWSQQNVSDEQAAKTYMGTAFMLAMRTVCEEWPRGPVDADFGTPLQSSVPTLILSGGNDPVTPDRYAVQILKGLRNGKHVIAAGQGHGQLATGCIPRLTAEFIATGSAAALDDGCVRNIRPTPFMLSRTAPAP
jgi:pimeloyl-ACP methyl ester carboxylesterase